MARNKSTKTDSENGVETMEHDWSWLVGENGVINAPVGAFYDRELSDAKAKKIMAEAKRVAKLAEEPDLGEDIERRLRAEAKHLVATAYYQQRDVDGVASISKNIEKMKAKKEKYEQILAKLTAGEKDAKEEDKEADKE